MVNFKLEEEWTRALVFGSPSLFIVALILSFSLLACLIILVIMANGCRSLIKQMGEKRLQKVMGVYVKLGGKELDKLEDLAAYEKAIERLHREYSRHRLSLHDALDFQSYMEVVKKVIELSYKIIEH